MKEIENKNWTCPKCGKLMQGLQCINCNYTGFQIDDTISPFCPICFSSLMSIHGSEIHGFGKANYTHYICANYECQSWKVKERQGSFVLNSDIDKNFYDKVDIVRGFNGKVMPISYNHDSLHYTGFHYLMKMIWLNKAGINIDALPYLSKTEPAVGRNY